LKACTHAAAAVHPRDHQRRFRQYRFWAFGLDGLLVVISVLSIWLHSFSFGIDFTGGVLMEVKAAQTIDIGKLRGEVDSLGFPESSCSISRRGMQPACQQLRDDPYPAQGGGERRRSE